MRLRRMDAAEASLHGIATVTVKHPLATCILPHRHRTRSRSTPAAILLQARGEIT